MSKLALTLALAAGLSSHFALSASARDGANYDGNWSVELVTENGAFCDARYSYSLSVVDGQVRPISKAASSGASVTGRVGKDGSVGLNVATSAASGSASGHLQVQNGSGTWKVSSLCSGRWTARRQTTRTAQAD
ncbi:hypothetical protein [Methylobacterium gnaphalii]|uniref:Large exoprotein involved in heme utilization or adhesion n=1 Tax=Methylobacterium gnaphalii TaxID=1010610 RepID=A0A512JJK6_9HYPH|nr:hypothetical protein [Methylobacterium gnaphalii]GEP10052.1 hypothetical protein MGN01_18970 [Methylobacterium gnaphalii]GJD67683.1 hypothetical protein MMMDOFMJ_0599 [Methylobacterium gnaphalii]GLS48322.1 hypothetical protein GCM10007885_11660 [Methylobacterium gnaphalii]